MSNSNDGIYAPRRAPVHEDLVLRGLRHRIIRWGPPSASPIVLLHGFLDVADTWQFLVDELPDDWSFVGLDWRGFGGSEWQPGGYWFTDYLADLEALLALVASGPARLLGHSMGGNIAALYGGIRPERIAWTVNLEGVGLPQTSPDEAPGRYARWLDELAKRPRQTAYASESDLAKYLCSRNPRLPQARAAFLARAWTRRVGQRYHLAADPQHRVVNPVLYRRDEAEACWRRGVAPMLLMLGEQSEYRTRMGSWGAAGYLEAAFPHLTLVTLGGVGHMMHHEAPDAVARHIEHFVGQQISRNP
ncbi:MAG TPA: alpha/beta hydrolase [Steroidobacteraceae bacterium]|nr:alpha/beta hydrolase [Steroidobacteraceae bacterium]HQW09529.1 alpha/beta hydrolase [Steroidobacteraceae bacterium]HQX47271.1 alpha/beta hydrolase [Steroidobacteraceae bacterium]HQX77270.1 alpha/beta hydrolase [Steroidobacteraceae bacterium]HQZ79518.1 alpha/beta hydrolase [Steroidobacteraceae bacterium]